VELRLEPALARCIGNARLEEAAARQIHELAEDLGIDAPASVTATVVEGQRPLSVCVDGTRQVYSFALMRCVWRAVAPAGLRDQIVLARHRGQTTDELLVEYAASSEADAEVLTSFAATLACETLRMRPGVLLTEAAMGNFGAQPGEQASEFAAILSAVLDRGVALRERSTIGATVAGLRASGRGRHAVVEELFAQLSTHSVEVMAHPDLLSAMGVSPHGDEHGVAIEDRDYAGNMAPAGAAIRSRLAEFGVTRPIVLAANSSLPVDCIRVRVNDRLGLPLPVARAGEVVVQASPVELEDAGIDARALVDPASGHRLSVFAEDDTLAAHTAGHETLSPEDYFAVAVAREIGVIAERLLNIDEVERDLAWLHDTHPSLVDAALAVYSRVTLTRTLRSLLAQQISIRDLWMVLNVLLSYEAVPVPDANLRVMDDRLAVPGAATDPLAATSEDLVAFARLRMCERVIYDNASLGEAVQKQLQVFTTDVTLERQVTDHSGGGDEIRDVVRHVLTRSGAAADAIVLTSAAARARLHQIVAPEFPTVRIVATSELPPGTSVQALGVLAL
jgi:type III secretory pathway component EscV